VTYSPGDLVVVEAEWLPGQPYHMSALVGPGRTELPVGTVLIVVKLCYSTSYSMLASDGRAGRASASWLKDNCRVISCRGTL